MSDIKGSVPSDIKITNRQMILEVYRDGEEHTPTQAAETVRLSRQTTAKAIEYFLSRGILVTAGKGASTDAGGRRPACYQLSRDICFAGINIGEDVTFTLFNLYQEVLAQHKEPLSREASYEDLENTVARGARVLAQALPENGRIEGVSVTVRGLIDSEKLSVRLSPYHTCWPKGQSVVSLLSFFPEAKLLVLDKPVRTFARRLLAEHPAWENRRILVLFSHAGAMAAALIDHGHIENGRNSIIGEAGFIVMSMHDGREGIFSELFNRVILDAGYNSLHEVFAASRAEDKKGRETCRKAASLFAAMLKNINLAFDADETVLLGEYAEADAYFLDCVKADLRSFVYYPADYEPTIILDPSPLDDLLLQGTMLNMLHGYYKEARLYNG